LAKEKTFSDTVINSIPGAFFVRDEEGNFVRASGKNEALTGYSTTELSKMKPTDFVVEREEELLSKLIRGVFTRGEASGEVNVRLKSGKEMPAYFTALRMTIDEKRYLVGTAIDITELKEAQAALQRAHDELEEKVAERTQELSQANLRLQELDRLKSMFLASMSHELRTPLNSIIGFVSWLLMGMEGDLNEEQNKQLTMVKNSAEHLLSLINDILDISKIESGKVDLSIEAFDVAEVAEEVAETVLPQTKEKGLALTVDVPEGIKLKSDKRRVKQVFMNLVSNAIKFTDQGSVSVTGKILNESSLEVTVSDSGSGIREEDMEKLFQPFQQIDMSSTKKHEGTGLGLYLCKKLMSYLQGTISAKSRHGEGSAFAFTLPLEWHEEG
jgi:PAS domain S-box-containing protein